MQKLKTTTLSIIIGLTFAAGITYATAVWNNGEGCTNCGTTSITSGSVISAENIKANFEWLKAQVLVNQTNGPSVSGKTNPPICIGEGKALQWDGNNWSCSTITQSSSAGVGMVVYDTSGQHSFTVPVGVVSIKVTVVGGGGGGGFGRSGSYCGDMCYNNPVNGASGGSGGSRFGIFNVTPNSVIHCIVGAGSYDVGGDSSFLDMIAYGGKKASRIDIYGDHQSGLRSGGSGGLGDASGSYAVSHGGGGGRGGAGVSLSGSVYPSAGADGACVIEW